MYDSHTHASLLSYLLVMGCGPNVRIVSPIHYPPDLLALRNALSTSAVRRKRQVPKEELNT